MRWQSLGLLYLTVHGFLSAALSVLAPCKTMKLWKHLHVLVIIMFANVQRQDAVYLLHPDGGNIEDWLGLAAAAFALRCLSLIHMIVMQCTVDIFFMDWERPRGISRSQDGKKTTEVPVTIWRTFFVANEWNEIQATRKINKVFQVWYSNCFLW